MATRKKSAARKTAKKAAKKAASKKKVTKKVAKKAAKKATRKASGKKKATRKVAKKAASKKKTTRKAAQKSAAVTKLPDVPDIDPNVQVQPLYGEPYKIKRGEDYMSPEMSEHFHNILLAWKADLMQEVDRTVHHMQDEAANFPDPNDRATQETEFNMELRTRDRERKLIKKIDESIEDLKNEEYGYCDVCGVEIGVRRLEARPTASQCIDCKTLDEIKEKQLG